MIIIMVIYNNNNNNDNNGVLRSPHWWTYNFFCRNDYYIIIVKYKRFNVKVPNTLLPYPSRTLPTSYPPLPLPFLAAAIKTKLTILLCFSGGFCDGKRDGDYANPSNCYGFISCSGGIAYDKPCAPGLKFNERIDACDYSAPCYQGVVR